MTKYRKFFVSNSSSSSFIIAGKDNIIKATEIINNCKDYYADYYLKDDKIYTSFISNSSKLWQEIYDIPHLLEIEGSHGTPYNYDLFDEVEGDRGVISVYIPKKGLKYYED